MNLTITTNLTTANLTFAGIVMQQICPDATIEEIHTATINHMNPFQLLVIASAVVAVFSTIFLGKKLLIYLFDVTGDGRVGCNDLARIARYCCPCCPCCGREEESNESNSDANRHPSLELELTSSTQENKSESLSSDTIAVAVHASRSDPTQQGETKVRALFVFCCCVYLIFFFEPPLFCF